MNRSVKVRVLLALGVSILLCAPAALASVLPKVPTFSGPYSKKDLPDQAVHDHLYRGREQLLAGQKKSANKDAPLSWTSWTANSAQGSGFNWIDNCKPNCAAGTFHSYAVSLKLWRPRPEIHRLVFTRMTVTYTGKLPPHTSSKNQEWKVTTHGKAYIWVFPS